MSELCVLFLFCVLWPPINVPTTGQRGVGSTEAEPFGKDEGVDLSVEAGGNIFAYVLLRLSHRREHLWSVPADR